MALGGKRQNLLVEPSMSLMKIGSMELDYLRLYIFADKYCMEDLMNETIDVLYDYYNLDCNTPEAWAVEFTLQHTAGSSSKLRLLMSTHWALLLVRDDSEFFKDSARMKLLEESAELDVAIMVAVGKWAAGRGIWQVTQEDGITSPKCDFHVHKKTATCV